MDCGIPFCQSGCPINNIIPDWNDLVYRGNWQRRARHAALDEQLPRVHRPRLPGALRGGVHAEHQQRCGRHQVDRARDHRQGLGDGLGRAAAAHDARPARRSRSSGPVPPAWRLRQQLARAGHDVTVFEKNDRVGGLLRYGIPDFKMEKSHIDRRVEQMQAEGVTFRTGVFVGTDPKLPGVTNWAKETISPEELTEAVRRGRADRRRRAAARPAGARPRAEGRALRDGVPAAAEQGRRRRQGARPADSPPASTSS